MLSRSGDAPGTCGDQLPHLTGDIPLIVELQLSSRLISQAPLTLVAQPHLPAIVVASPLQIPGPPRGTPVKPNIRSQSGMPNDDRLRVNVRESAMDTVAYGFNSPSYGICVDRNCNRVVSSMEYKTV